VFSLGLLFSQGIFCEFKTAKRVIMKYYKLVLWYQWRKEKGRTNRMCKQ